MTQLSKFSHIFSQGYKLCQKFGDLKDLTG